MEKSTKPAAQVAGSPTEEKRTAANPTNIPTEAAYHPSHSILTDNFFTGRDWLRGPDGKPEEIVVNGRNGPVKTGRFRLVNLHKAGDVVLDGNGDSYLVMPDMSLRAVSKLQRRHEREERLAARKAERKAKRQTKQ